MSSVVKVINWDYSDEDDMDFTSYETPTIAPTNSRDLVCSSNPVSKTLISTYNGRCSMEEIEQISVEQFLDAGYKVQMAYLRLYELQNANLLSIYEELDEKLKMCAKIKYWEDICLDLDVHHDDLRNDLITLNREVGYLQSDQGCMLNHGLSKEQDEEYENIMSHNRELESMNENLLNELDRETRKLDVLVRKAADLIITPLEQSKELDKLRKMLLDLELEHQSLNHSQENI